MIIDHIGIVVPALTHAIEQLTQVFEYRQATEIVTNTRQQVRVVFMEKPLSTTIKLIEPTDSRSPVYRLSQKGGGLHHICFRCSDVKAETSRLNALGFRVLSSPQPGEAFENHEIAFVYCPGIGLNLELIDTDLKARRFEANR